MSDADDSVPADIAKCGYNCLGPRTMKYTLLGVIVNKCSPKTVPSQARYKPIRRAQILPQPILVQRIRAPMTPWMALRTPWMTLRKQWTAPWMTLRMQRTAPWMTLRMQRIPAAAEQGIRVR